MYQWINKIILKYNQYFRRNYFGIPNNNEIEVLFILRIWLEIFSLLSFFSLPHQYGKDIRKLFQNQNPNGEKQIAIHKTKFQWRTQ